MNHDASMFESSVNPTGQSLPNYHETETSLPYRAMDKCANCRRRKKACRPFGRKWPEDGPCEGCKKASLECGPNTRQRSDMLVMSSPTDLTERTHSSIARAVTSAEWNLIKASFENSYIDEKKPLKDVMKIMQRDHGFRASRRQYHGQIEKWGLQKYKKPATSRNGTPSSTGSPSLEYARLSISAPVEPKNIIRMRPPERAGVLSGARQILGAVSGIGRSPLQHASSPGHDHFVLVQPGAGNISNPSRLPSAQDIRLVRLAPGNRNEPISIRLHMRDVDKPQEYAAVSCSWEFGKGSETVDFNNEPRRIEKDLETVLHYFRDESMPRWLWIDTICINAQDPVENSRQVQLMPEIYSDASEMLVWLGADTVKSTHAIRFVQTILNISPLENMVKFPESLHLWEAFNDMLILPWFRRAFSLQEVSFAQKCTLYWGSSSISWLDFVEALDMVVSMETSLQKLDLGWSGDFFHQIQVSSVMQLVSTSRLITAVSRDTRIGDRRPSLETLLFKTRSLHSTNARDRIYALLGLFSKVWRSDEPPRHPASMVFAEAPSFDSPSSIEAGPDRPEFALFSVNYQKETWKICVEVIELVLQQSDSLDSMCRPWAPELPGLPSWISTLDRDSFKMAKSGFYTRVNADALVGAPDLVGKPYNACKIPHIAPRRLGHIIDTNVLAVQGFALCRVSYVAPVAIEGIVPADWRVLAQWENLETLPPAPFWRTVVANRDHTGRKAPPSYFARVCQWAFNHPPPGEPLNTNEMLRMPKCPPYVAVFLRRVQAVVWKRRLFMTNEGYIGIGPAHMQTGDSVNILSGCSVPVVLRELGDMSYYQLIGDCYVDGMMDGEACREESPYSDYFLR